MIYTLTTPLYYVNDKPHLGSTYTTIACDALARFQRLEGHEVVFVTGVDEHGQKIQRTAADQGISPIDHCNRITARYEKAWKEWDISNDRFVRTTSPRHLPLVQQFFQRCEEAGDIRSGRQTGWYCVGCEEFKDDPAEALDEGGLEDFHDCAHVFFREKLNEFERHLVDVGAVRRHGHYVSSSL